MPHLFEQLLTHAQTTPLALCTLVNTKGSCPQSKGAKMLVLQNGQTLGTLGGGCVEAEVRREALQKIAQNQSATLTFKLDSDYGWDDGLICGGTMQVHIQTYSAPTQTQPLIPIINALKSRQPTEFKFTYTTEQGEQTYLEPLPPKPILLIAGAGHVGHALANLNLDFQLTILDDRPDYASKSRFPNAHQLLTGNIETELQNFPIDPETYIVIVTRGHKNDGSALHAVIHSPAKYIGLIGSKRKILTILSDLHQKGIPLDLLKKIHAPIGLNISAVTPNEIAISIAAELIATRHHHTAPITPMQLPTELLNHALTRTSPNS